VKFLKGFFYFRKTRFRCIKDIRGTNIDDKYKVIIIFNKGQRTGLKITIDGINQNDIMDVLDELTQYQIKNAQVQVQIGDQLKDYFDFLFEQYRKEYLNDDYSEHRS